jgi:hypothetical protein
MPSQSKFQDIFDTLKTIMLPYVPQLSVVIDEPEHLHLNTHHIMDNKKPFFFGAIRVTKAYVTYHLLPIYVFPELLDDLSPQLQKRKQGKSCFNFTTRDEDLFQELASLTERGYTKYQESDYV